MKLVELGPSFKYMLYNNKTLSIVAFSMIDLELE